MDYLRITWASPSIALAAAMPELPPWSPEPKDNIIGPFPVGIRKSSHVSVEEKCPII
jgi:hypothetical protein